MRGLTSRGNFLEMDANSSAYIRLKFCKSSEISSSEVALFLVDENGSCEECFLFNVLP